MKLLIVDDSTLVRRMINSVYSKTTFTEIETATDGLLAVTIFKKFLPDVVTLDITMPNMDGLAAMSKMLEIKPNTIIFVISALADYHTAIESLTRGAHQFICKPFSDEDLKEALDNLIAETRDKSKIVPESSLETESKISELHSERSVTPAAPTAPVPSIVSSVPPVPPLSNSRQNTPPPVSDGGYQSTRQRSECDTYPSGYVPPPVVQQTYSAPQANGSANMKITDSVRNQMSISEIRKQFQY